MNCSFRNKRLRQLSDEEIPLDLEAHMPSGSEDEQFGLSDDSYVDREYRPPSDDVCEMDTECLEQDDYDELEQVTLTMCVKHSRTDESTVECEPASKKVIIKPKIWR